MTNTTTLITVLEAACLTEDRGPNEQRAMLALALKLDKERGAFVSGNTDLHPPTLVAHVEATYDPSTGKPVSLDRAHRLQYERLRASWSACTDCAWPAGMHYADGVCPRVGDYLVRHGGDALLAWRAARRVSA